MPLRYEQAGLVDLDRLTDTRVQVLRAANGLPDTADLSEVRAQSARYYAAALQDGTHIAYLVWDGNRIVGTGGVSFYQVMPTCHNPSGRKAYLMNLYTDPAYRRLGIARQTLHLLVQAAKQRGISAISLEATDMGRPLYEAYDFVPMTHEMALP